MKSWGARDKQVIWHPFAQMADWIREPQLTIVRGEGSYLIDDQGRRYLDGVSSLWCNVHGHNHPRLDAALRAQLDRMAHSTFLGLTHPTAIELAEMLVAAAPKGLSRVFYSDSGSTAVEIALKQAFQYWQLRGEQRRHFVRLEHAYHGDTLGAVGVGGIELFHRIFGPLIVDSIAVPSPASHPNPDGLTPEEISERSLRALAQVLASRGREIAAVVMEPLVQGAAGMIMHPPGFLAGVSTLCREHGTLLILDEVATGFGRTGTLFACEQEEVSPDFLCLAKGISGGYLPLAATLTREEIFSEFLGERREMKAFFHGHTYTANPLACAVGIESLAMLEEGVLERGKDLAGYLGRLLRDFISPMPWIGDIRQRGLMIGIELVAERSSGRPFASDAFQGARVCAAARRHGVILRPLGDVIVWMPPLAMTRDDADLLAHATIRALEDACS
jgi:adenosylmethionine---8-amino-7-oxononanoate aminotransferase